MIKDLFDLTTVESTPVQKRSKISKALFKLAKKWQVELSDNSCDSENDREENEEILKVLTDIIDDVNEIN